MVACFWTSSLSQSESPMASSTMNRWLRPEVRSDPPLIFSLQFTVRSDLSISLYFLFDFCVFIDLMWTWMCVCRFIRSSQPWGLLWGSADSSWFATSASTLMSGLSPSPFRSVLGSCACLLVTNACFVTVIGCIISSDELRNWVFSFFSFPIWLFWWLYGFLSMEINVYGFGWLYDLVRLRLICSWYHFSCFLKQRMALILAFWYVFRRVPWLTDLCPETVFIIGFFLGLFGCGLIVFG